MEVVGQAVLKDYPLRLWVRQQEHFDDLLREFKLLLIGEEQDDRTGSDAPRELVELADMFTTRYGTAIDAINASRHEAYEQGRDRMDSVVPLVPGTPDLMDRVAEVMASVDDYCRRGDLLTLARPAELRELAAWTNAELKRQYAGGEPTPWPGPF